MIRRNIADSRGRNLTKLNLNSYPERMINNLVESTKAKTRKSNLNPKADTNGFSYVFKSNNNVVPGTNTDKSRSYLQTKDTEVLQTMNYEDLKSLQDIRTNIQLHSFNEKNPINTSQG